MEEKEFCSAELTDKLKKSGFVFHAWVSIGRKTFCPSMYAVQRWLREQRKLSVRINYHKERWFADVLNIEDSSYADTDFYATYEEAFEAGLDRALDMCNQDNTD